MDASLHSVHCITGRCSNSTLADRLRRNGPPHWVCKRAAELTCDACESRKPLKRRNRATFEYETKPWSQVGLGFMDLTLVSHKNFGKGTGDGASGFADGSDICVIRAYIETRQRHRRRVCSITRIWHIIQDPLQYVSIKMVVLFHVNAHEVGHRSRSHSWTSTSSTWGRGEDNPNSETIG